MIRNLQASKKSRTRLNETIKMRKNKMTFNLRKLTFTRTWYAKIDVKFNGSLTNLAMSLSRKASSELVGVGGSRPPEPGGYP